MEVVGKSKATVVLDSCLNDSATYFSDHPRIVRCNPYCTDVRHLKDAGLYQWVFQVQDPRSNPITAVFFVEQYEEPFSLPPGSGSGVPGDRCIRWSSPSENPAFSPPNAHTFIGSTDSKICLRHLDACRTEVHFQTDITLDFELSFPLNLMPEGVLKFMSEAVMSQIMQQATESMLSRVRADIGCSIGAVVAGAGRA